MFNSKKTDQSIDRCNQTWMYWVQKNAQLRPDQQAIAFGERSISYSEFDEQSRRFASGLKSLGVGKGDVVALQLPNVPEFIIAYLAICRIGAVMQTLHMPYRKADLSQLLASSMARVVVCLHSFKDFEAAKEMRQLKDNSALEHVVVLGEAINGTENYQLLLKSEPLVDDYEDSQEDVFLLLYTSGTTSSPKGVPIRYRNFMGNAYKSVAELDISAGDPILSVAPMTHLYGLFVLHITLAAGGVCSLLEAFTPDGFLKVLKTDKPVGIFAAPAHFNQCLTVGLLNKEALGATRFVCLSGSVAPPELVEAVDVLMENGSVIQLWGMSELQAGSFGRPSDPQSMRYTTAGRPSPDTKLRIVSEQGDVLPVGEEGEIQVSGPSVFSGYLNNEQENTQAFTQDKWFCTGDLGRIVEHGYLQLTGRLKEIINRGGVKYNPLDIEAIIDKMENVQRSAIVPIADTVLREKACVFIAPTALTTVTLEEIKWQLANADIAKYKWPEMIEIIDEMPLTPTQKVIRGKLKPVGKA